MIRRLLGLLLVGASAGLGAQCPDGALPPCRTAAPPRVTPVLDERTWIVVPFDNVARAADVDWLRDASVNLLYLELSRFSDIRVVDDERVAGFVRDVVGKDARRPLTLDDGVAIARRSGAGRLVMGDILKTGNRTTVVAKVYDARDGRRLRSAREETGALDSVMSVFGRLAPKVLDVPTSPGIRAAGMIGTSSLAAYQAYLDAVKALNRMDFAAARERLGRALSLDSTFALAHYKLAIVEQWASGSVAVIQRNAEAAARLSTGLPARERQLIAAERRFASSDYPGACTLYHALVAADSTDVDALFGMGECEFHDLGVIPASADSSTWKFRASRNTALRAFRRVLELEPANHLAASATAVGVFHKRLSPQT